MKIRTKTEFMKAVVPMLSPKAKFESHPTYELLNKHCIIYDIENPSVKVEVGGVKLNWKEWQADPSIAIPAYDARERDYIKKIKSWLKEAKKKGVKF